MNLRCVGGLALALAVATIASLPARAVARPAQYGDRLQSGVPIEMSDGTHLVADVVFPADPHTGERAPGRFPVLLIQTPYLCETTIGPTRLSADVLGGWEYYARRGYIFASVCVRGTGRSGGGYGAFSPRDQQDGVELVDWAATEVPGANGKVGLIGCSYMGLTQIFTAGAVGRHSPVKAISPSCAGAEIFREVLTAGGVPTGSLEYLFPFSTVLLGPRAQVVGAQLAASMLTGGDRAYARGYWESRRPGAFAKAIVRNRIPALLWSGWDDVFGQGAIEMYAYLQNAAAGRTPNGPMDPRLGADPRYQLIMGPWGHGGGITADRQLAWFDTWIRGAKSEFTRTRTPLHIFERAGDRWLNTTTWPPVTRYTELFLGQDGTLAPQPGPAGSDRLQYAPRSRLSYTSRPFREGGSIIGPVAARLRASTTGTNLHLVADLEDLGPDGTIQPVTYGNQLGSQRALDRASTWRDNDGRITRPWGRFTGDSFLKPGQSETLNVMLRPTAYTLAPGHRLRLVLRTQVPLTECELLLDTRPCLPNVPQQTSLPGNYTIEHGGRRPPALRLPLLPRNCFPASGGRGAEPVSLRGPKGLVSRRSAPCGHPE